MDTMWITVVFSENFVTFIEEFKKYQKTPAIILFSEIRVQVGGSDIL
jgi:hypothetical protein